MNRIKNARMGGRLGLIAGLAGTLATVVGSSAGTASVYADEPVSAVIDPGTKYQTMQGWGTSLAWFANVLGSAKDPNRVTIADKLFSPTKGIGLNVVRYNIGGGENPKYDTMEPRAAVPGFEPKPGVWTWGADANQRWFLRAAIARGANQLEAFSNSPPWWMTVSGSVTGSIDGTSDNLKKQDYAKFAQYLTTVVNKYRTHYGVTFQTVDPFNEPTSTWWKFGGRQEGSHFDPSTQNIIVKMLGKDLSATHSPTTIAVADDNSIDDTVDTFSSFDTAARKYITQINTHAYNGFLRTNLANLAQQSGKTLWMSEYGDGDGSGFTLATEILADVRMMHATAWVYWQGVDDSSGLGWGLLSSNLNSPTDYSYQINEKYYVMGQFSKFIRPGSIIVSDTDAHSLAAYDPQQKELVVVETNVTGLPRATKFSFPHFNASGRVSVYETTRYQSTDNIKHVADMSTQNGGLSYTVAPYSVTTLVIPGTLSN